MAVARGSAARERLRALLDRPRPDRPWTETEPLPPGMTPDPPEHWLWARPAADPGGQQPALRDPAAYLLVPDVTVARSIGLHEPPDTALTGDEALTAGQQAYVRASLDVTMKGGTTSGVVYPLALCELARRFRLRNVGGASAGAIGASLAAAAEVGRARWDAAGRPPLPAPTGAERSQGRVRQGFVGLADATAWFSQVDDPGREQFRVAQLFRPTDAGRAIFRLAVAAMRGRWAALGALLLWAFGPGSRMLTALVLFAAPLLAVVGRTTTAGPLLSWLFVAAVLACGTVALVCLLATLAAVAARFAAKERTDPRLLEPVTPPAPAKGSAWWPPLLALVVFGGLLVLLQRAALWSELTGWRLLCAWLFLVVALVVIQIGGVLGVVAGAKQQRFGLVSGSVPAATFRRRGRLWDVIAGLPRPTLDDALVPWLDRALADLAGLTGATSATGTVVPPQTPASVLRFGHLWLGDAYSVPDGKRARDLDQLRRLQQAADQPRRRVVNLELMTTELVHGIPYRFPLGRSTETSSQTTPVDSLFLRRSDLDRAGGEVFPAAVVEALCPSSARVHGTVYDVESGEAVDDLYPLPEPWDLPVLFATRLSLALPGLFQAVRVYRLAFEGGQRVRDDYSARLVRDGTDVRYPPGQQRWVEELWFSDGGITSNFPIHLFDTPLPLWPTVGISLGTHPRGYAHQDVWLPASSQGSSSPSRPQRGSLLGFASAVFGTALGWSDTGQTFMPAFRGRVAWVRQRRDEGGANLFMASTTIASLALRGGLAGRRLAERYADDAHWQVHQWLRLRVALDNLAALHGRVARAARTPPYATLDGPSAVDALKDDLQRAGGDPSPAFPDGPEAPLQWYDEGLGPEFFAATAALLASYTASPGTSSEDLAPVREGVPEPASELRQVPPT